MEQALVGTIVPLLSDETNGKDKDYEEGKGKILNLPSSWHPRRGGTGEIHLL